MPRRLNHTLASLLILLAAGIWGSAFYFQKTAMEDLSPVWFLALRGAVAALTLLPFAVWERRRAAPAEGNLLRYGVSAGLLFLVAGWMQQKGLMTATVTNTGFLTSLYVVATPFIYWVFMGRRPPTMVFVAAAIATTGTGLISGAGLPQLGSGDLWILASTVLWGGFIVTTAAAAGAQQPITLTFIQFATLALTALPLALMQGLPAEEALTNSLPELLFVGVLSSALTFVLMATALARIEAPQAAVLLSTEVLFAAGAGYLLLGERLSLLGWLGALLILSATVLINRSAKR